MPVPYLSKHSFYAWLSLAALPFSSLCATYPYQNFNSTPQHYPTPSHYPSPNEPYQTPKETPQTNSAERYKENRTHGYGREEIAYKDNGDDSRDHYSADWDYKESWRHNRSAFFKGETQPQAYREQHPYGPAGIGYDADENYHKDNGHSSDERKGDHAYRENGYASSSSRNEGNGENAQRGYHSMEDSNRSYRSTPSGYRINQGYNAYRSAYDQPYRR